MPKKWNNIPSALSSLNQWLLADKHGAPCDVNLRNVPLNDKSNYLSFEEACEAALRHNAHIGFVVTENDPFTCLDIDVIDEERQKSKGQAINPAKWTTQVDLDRFWKIAQTFASYTERSRSGKGLHIWIYGKAKNCARDGVDVRSRNMFLICTRDVVIPSPIVNGQYYLDILVSEINANRSEVELVEVPPTKTDDQIWRMACEAANSEKFKKLCNGEWQGPIYPSQSEADYALMSMFAFYSESNEQCRRMFRMTKLGQRDKSLNSDTYLNRSLRGIRARLKDEQAGYEDCMRLADGFLQTIRDGPTDIKSLIAEKERILINPESQFGESLEATFSNLIAPTEDPDSSVLPWPPGIVGDVARYMHSFAPRPVQEISIAAALGLFAGLCGKSFNLPKTGLNLYLILVAQSGVGKEALHSGISAVISQMPELARFVEFSEFASGQALKKFLPNKDSFVNIQGEFGKMFKRFSNVHDSGATSLRTVITDLYQKSSANSKVGGIAYSNSDKNSVNIDGVAYSLIGETTPGTLNAAITEDMMEDGFLSRFLLIEYKGLRPPLNTAVEEPLPDRLKTVLSNLALRANRPTTLVFMTDEAKFASEQFDKRCDVQINSSQDESYRQLWNRAHLKTIRVAGVLAAANASTDKDALITLDMMNWAISLTTRNIDLIQSRMNSGEIGEGDSSRYNYVVEILKDYLKNGCSKGYKEREEFTRIGIVTKAYLQKKTQSKSMFNKHRAGAKVGLDVVINSLIDNGVLVEINKSELQSQFGFQGRAYRVVGGF